ncbi:MAG TPA: hypothetical protein VF079_02360 [Sphingomicrobium sp.]
MQYKVVTAALASLLFSSSASAWDNPQSNSAAAKPQAKEKTYCFQFSLDTGSRISRMECKTKKEWERLGVDVDSLTDK